MKRLIFSLVMMAMPALAQIELNEITPTPGMPTVGFEGTCASGFEHVSPIRVRVVLSQATSNNVTVNYTATGSAQNGADFSLADSTLTIPAGQTTGYIEFPVVEENDIDSDESVKIILSNQQNAALGQNIFTYVIKNNDRDPDLPQQPPLVTMTAGSGNTVVFRLSQPYTSDIASVDYQIILNQTGTTLRYTIGTGTVTFQRGENEETLAIPQPTDDIDVPGAKTITVYINNPVNLAIDNPMHSFSFQ